MEKLRIQLNEYLNKMVRRGAILGVLAGLLPAILILYVGYSFSIAPGMQGNDAKASKVAALETEVAKGKAVEASQEDFKRDAEKVVEVFYDSLPLLPKETELSNVLAGVQQVATRYKVVLTGLNAVKEGQKTPNADKLYEREMPATVVGNYDDVMRFFLDLSRQTRILIVRDYSVQSAVSKQKGARPSFVSVDFSLLAYHAPPTSEFPNLPGFIKQDFSEANTTSSSSIHQVETNYPTMPLKENVPPPLVAPPSDEEIKRLNDRAREIPGKKE